MSVLKKNSSLEYIQDFYSSFYSFTNTLKYRYNSIKIIKESMNQDLLSFLYCYVLKN